jgi:hypothetical protein
MSGLRHPGNRINVFRSVICLERFVDVFVSNASHHSGMMYKVRYERVFSLYIDDNVHSGNGVRNGNVVFLLRLYRLRGGFIVSSPCSDCLISDSVYLVQSREKSQLRAADWRLNHSKRLSVADRLHTYMIHC